MERINNFFAPVISSDRIVELLSKRSYKLIESFVSVRGSRTFEGQGCRRI